MPHLLPLWTLAALGVAGLVAGFVDAIAGGGGLLTIPALVLAGLDPVAAVATNKLNGTIGTASATWVFARLGRIDLAEMWPTALTAGIGAIIGALLLPIAPRSAVDAALPLALIAVALYFAFSPQMSDADRRQRLSARGYAFSIAPVVGLYDGVFGPGAGSFYTIGLIVLLGFGVTRAIANARLANFASNLGSLAIFAVSGQIVVSAGLAMALGQFLGSRLGAHAVLGAGVKLVRPLVVTVSCLMALRLAARPGNPVLDALVKGFSALIGG
ncbi:MAG TPA: TSUP family transporter [Roseiarcus sp.]|nr:TSUP family transporter [Roseiarcus sp.]